MGYVDADAHVIESPDTWAFIPEADKKFTPILVNQSWGPPVKRAGRNAVEYWIMDNRYHARDQNITMEATAE